MTHLVPLVLLIDLDGARAARTPPAAAHPPARPGASAARPAEPPGPGGAGAGDPDAVGRPPDLPRPRQEPGSRRGPPASRIEFRHRFPAPHAPPFRRG